MAGHESEMIMFLLTSLSAILGGVIKYLLNRCAKLEQIVDENNKTLLLNNAALAKANEALAKMVGGRSADSGI